MKDRQIVFSSLLIIMFAIISFVISGCSDDTSTSITAPNSGVFKPVGTIQGVVKDSVTQEPIANAVVSIGIATGTTDSRGQYILKNVPATEDALNGSISSTYTITVDLTSVSNNIDRDSTNNYPQYKYIGNITVKYTSLNDSTPCPDPEVTGDNADVESSAALQNCGSNSTNHDTAVDGLVANQDITIGKLNATIKGVVAGCDLTGFEDEFFTPVGSGYTVKLITASTSSNSSSGAAGRIVTSTTTDEKGAFEFANIEAGQSFSITAVDSANTESDTISVTSPSDGETLVLSVQESTALHICPDDAHGPEIIAITNAEGNNIEVGSDIEAGLTSVVLKFNEPVKQDAGTSTDASSVSNLFDNIEVNFDGNKAGNVAYTLDWDNDDDTEDNGTNDDNINFNQLTVTFTTSASSLYHIRIKDINNGTFTDSNNKNAELGICPDDSTVPTSYGIIVDTDTSETTGTPIVLNDCTVYFTTNGGQSVTAPTITLVNDTSLDQASVSINPNLDWNPVAGAKEYRIYRAVNRVWDDTTSQTGQLELCTTVTVSQFSGDDLKADDTTLTCDNTDGTAPLNGFVESNEIQLTYTYQVSTVNSDDVESSLSTAITAEDKAGPGLVAGTAVFTDTNADGNIDQIVVGFNEDVDEISGETTANYSLATDEANAPNVTIAIYDPSTNSVTLTIDDTFTSTALTNNAADDLNVSNVKDIAGNIIKTGADRYNMDIGTVE